MKPMQDVPNVFSAMMQPISFKTAPSVLVFEINTRNIKVSKALKFEWEGETAVLNVRGLIYYGDFYFKYPYLTSVNIFYQVT